MKNKLLVSIFAVVVVAFAITSCERKSNVTDVCTDMLKESIHKSVRSLVQQDGQKLSIYEYEFPGGVDDNRLIYRTIAFGNGVYEPKQVENMTYTYGEWNEGLSAYSLNVTPSKGDPFTLIFTGNSLITPDGDAIGGDGYNTMARVEKWEKTIASFPNTAWEGSFAGDFVLDSVFEDSIRTRVIPGKGKVTDTIQVYKGKMDTLNADTTCYVRFNVTRDASTLANKGHFYMKSVRSKYNKKTKELKIISEDIKDYDFSWCFSDVSSDSRFVIELTKDATGKVEDQLSISKYKAGDDGKGMELLYNGMNCTRFVLP